MRETSVGVFWELHSQTKQEEKEPGIPWISLKATGKTKIHKNLRLMSCWASCIYENMHLKSFINSTRLC